MLISLLLPLLVSAQTPATVTADFTNPRQTIQGFGGAIAFYNNWVTAHPYKGEIYQALFDPANGLGISILRLQNLYRYQQAPNFDTDGPEFVQVAANLRGTPIPVLMSSWTPPAALKSNGAEGCPNTKNCTLAANSDGSFRYSDFAAYWADSIAAYRTLGVDPTWVSIQNEPDWIADYGSCKFTPSEAMSSGVTYAGYDRALDAVYHRLQSIDRPPVLVGPEVLGIGYNEVQNYMTRLNASEIGALAHHLYHGGDPAKPDTFNPVFDTLRTSYAGLPRFETEYGEGKAFQTAWIIQNALVDEEVSAYLYWSLVWPDRQQLIQIDFPWDRSKWTSDHGWSYNDQYFAVKHFSFYIQPGFRRLAMSADHPALRVSAFISPDGNRFVAVVINTSTTDAVYASLSVGDFNNFPSTIYRSDFSPGSTERFTNLGSLDGNNAVVLGPGTLATVVIDRQ